MKKITVSFFAAALCVGAVGASVRHVDVFVAGGTLDAVRAAVRAKAEGKSVYLAAPRPYLGEDRAGTFMLERRPDDDPDDPIVREIFNPAYHAAGAYKVLPAKGWRAVQKFAPYEEVATTAVTGALDSVTTPLLVKRACDKALLAAGVEYLTSAQTVSATKEGLWRVVVATRSGDMEFLAKEFKDLRFAQKVPAGRRRFSIRCVKGPEPHVEKVEFEYDVPFGDMRGIAAVENYARSLLKDRNLLDVAELVVPEGDALPQNVQPAAPMRDLGEYDVVVAGGGTGGGPAGMAAARCGAKTLVVEFQHVLGGVSTEGRIGGGGSYDGNMAGFAVELRDSLKAWGGFCIFAESEWLRSEIMKAGGDVWPGTAVTGAVMDGKRLVGVVVAMADGTRGVVRCKVAVDATGNCDLASAAGCGTEFITRDELSLQGVGMAGQPLGAGAVNSDIGFVDDTDAEDMFRFALRSRLSLPDRVWNQSSLVDSRERRRLRGAFRITPIDLLLNRTYPDTICRARSTFDTHGQTVHPVFFIRDTGKRGDCISANIPYRALLPETVDGVIVTGLGISAHRDSMPVLRMKADIRNQGYAAGIAAAMAAKTGVAPRAIDVKALQRRLVEIGNLPPEVLHAKDNLPVPDEVIAAAAKRIANGYDGLAELLSDPERAIPALRRETSFESAHVRAMMGDATAAGALVAKLRGAEWDEGWNFKGMSQYHRSVSWIDSYVIALGRTRAKSAVPVLDALAAKLTGESEYSHFRALSLAYQDIGDASGAAALARLLALPGVSGHALKPGELPKIEGYSDLVMNTERSMVLRELCVARALYRVGDLDGRGRGTLEAFADDPRRVYGNFARLVLAH